MEQTAVNPLVEPWTGGFGGVPPFDRVRLEQFADAFATTMDEKRLEIRRIVENPEPASFTNTIAAQERSGRAFGRATSIWSVYTSAFNTAEVQELDREWSPKMAAFGDEIIQNSALFERIEALDASMLTPEQQRLAWHYRTTFVRCGARLNPEQKATLSQYNQRLAELYTQFSQNELADEENHRLILDNEDDLAGLPEGLRESAAATASEKGLDGKWAIANTRSAVEPFLTYSERRDLRRQAFEMFTKRGDNGGEHDNNAIITEILRLRARRAQILGYPTHAHWQLEDSMALTPEAAMKLMLEVWPAAVRRVHEEVADMQALAPDPIEPWDYRFYAEKVRKARYDLDDALLQPYLQIEKLREALFWVSGRLFGFQWTEVEGLPVPHPDMRVFEVKGADDHHVGLLYWDPFAREAKSSGAWMTEYRGQESFDAPVTPIVANHCNFSKGAPGAAVTISWDDANTMFHEFGHALHGLCSSCSYPSLAGTNTVRDFVELPSQLFENWLSAPEVLKRFALHVETGEPMPDELIERIHKASTFNQGFSTTEYLISALVDMKLHLAGDVPIDPRAFEAEALAEQGLPRELVMRHRLPHFGHIFSGDGYSAAYYSYLWSAVYEQDAFQAFRDGEGPFDPEVARRLHDHILSVGNSVDPAQAYRNFRGRDASIEPLLRDRGFL